VILREMRRVLRLGGRLILVNMAVGETWRHRAYEVVYRLSPSLMGGCRGVELAPFVKQASFEVASVEHVSQLGFRSEIVVGRAT
jgi:hypothetical protein